MSDRSNEVLREADRTYGKKKKTRIASVVTLILCVLGALILWLYVMYIESPTYEDTVDDIEVRLENADVLSSNNLSVYSGSGNHVKIRVSGKKSLINRLTKDDIHAAVDLTDVTESGRRALPVTVDLPYGVTLVESEPSSITVYVDETETRAVPLTANVSLGLSEPYELGTVEFRDDNGAELDTVTVVGPKNVVSSVAKAQVSVDASGKTSTFTSRLPVTLADADGNRIASDYLKCSPMEIGVVVPIYVTKEIEIPVGFKYGYFEDGSNVRVTATPSVLTVRGSESDLNSASAVKQIVVDEKKIEGRSYSVTVTPELAAGLTLISQPAEVTVNVEITDSTLVTKDYTVENITATGAKSGLKYSVVDTSATVTLRGNSKKLAAIDDGDVTLEVDLTGYDENSKGTVSCKASVLIDSEGADGVFEVGEYTVQVKIG